MSGDTQSRLVETFDKIGPLAIAVSGGVDSMVLAFIANQYAVKRPQMIHAVSPAVPQEATARVKRYAERDGWQLSIIDAGEFADADYRANPVNRCYFCKSNLYDRIRSITPRNIASGANLDDLGDYRPGLKAAAERDVVHPYIRAKITKADIYALAALHGLEDLAELPAQPCLSSRVETGIGIDPVDLAFIEKVETEMARIMPKGATVRCRVTHQGVAVEIGESEIAQEKEIRDIAALLCAEAHRPFAGLRPYKRGSAFLGKPT